MPGATPHCRLHTRRSARPQPERVQVDGAPLVYGPRGKSPANYKQLVPALLQSVIFPSARAAVAASEGARENGGTVAPPCSRGQGHCEKVARASIACINLFCSAARGPLETALHPHPPPRLHSLPFCSRVLVRDPKPLVGAARPGLGPGRAIRQRPRSAAPLVVVRGTRQEGGGGQASDYLLQNTRLGGELRADTEPLWRKRSRWARKTFRLCGRKNAPVSLENVSTVRR